MAYHEPLIAAPGRPVRGRFEIIDVPEMVPLREAMLCCDCERIFAGDGGHRCPGCGSGAVLNLARALDRAERDSSLHSE